MDYKVDQLIRIIITISFCNLVFSCGHPMKKTYTEMNGLDSSVNDYDIHVLTTDSVLYFFSADKYQFDSQTLEGLAIITNDSTFLEMPEDELKKAHLVVIDKSEIEKIIRWGRDKQPLPSFTDTTFIYITVGFFGLILIWILIQSSIKESQSV